MKLLLTCEHATNAVPPRYQALFRGGRQVLQSHAAYDPGALAAAQQIQSAARAHDPALPEGTLLRGRITRLLVDLNRSAWNAERFSRFSRMLTPAERARLDEQFHAPYHEQALAAVRTALAASDKPGPSRSKLPRRTGDFVLHISVHSFTPEWKGRPRDYELGLLYDTRRPLERNLVDRWLREMSSRRDLFAAALPRLGRVFRAYRNRPYFGHTDGLTASLRGEFPAARYVAIELELSQAWCVGRRAQAVVRLVSESLFAALSAAAHPQ